MSIFNPFPMPEDRALAVQALRNYARMLRARAKKTHGRHDVQALRRKAARCETLATELAAGLPPSE